MREQSVITGHMLKTRPVPGVQHRCAGIALVPGFHCFSRGAAIGRRELI